MPTYHRSQRLRIVGTGPKVEQLQEGRFRLTFTCTSTNPNEAWMNGNKDQIMTAYGTLQSAQKNIAGIDPRTDEAYSDMVLFRTEANPSERDLIITLIYETATTSFVKSQDDKIDFELNGLQRVTRVTIAKTGTSLPSVTIGTTSITVNSTACKLASRSVEENDAFIQITETYLQEGTISKTQDNVGSQLAQVITTFGSDPAAISGYSIASKEESNFSGYQTNTFRFLKENVQLSLSVDNESPLKTEVREYFKPDASKETLANYSLVNKQESNVDGIPTERYTFAKNNVTLSTSEDKIGSQLAIVKEVFNGTPSTPSGYSIADEQTSSVDGIPTKRFRFLKNNVTLSTSEDKVGSQLAIVKEVFNGTPSTPSGYSIADEQISSVDGIPTRRFRFLKNNVTLSTSEDKVGSQLAIVKEVFNGTPSTPSGYSIADEQVSNVDGIVTRRFRFLKNNVTLSTSEDKVGSQLAIVKETFNGTPSTPTNYSIAKEDVSSVDGIPTKRFTFLKPSILSVSQDFTLDINQITVQAFSRTEAEVKAALTEVTNDHKLIRKSEQNHDGIATTSYVFEINTSDVVNYTANNRLQIVRTIYEAHDYDYNANYDVGSTSITFTHPDSSTTNLTLSELRVNKRGASGTFVKLEAIFTETGEVSRTERSGPSAIPGTEIVSINSSGLTPVTLTETDDIKLIDKQQQNNNGFSSFVRAYLKGTDATSTTNTYVSGRTYKVNSTGNYSSVGGPSTGVVGDYFQATGSATLGGSVTAFLVGQIIGTKVSYENIISVKVPGTVKCITHDAIGDLASNVTNSNKSQATIESVPPNTIKIKATVTESIQTSVPSITTLAYNLDNISCSVTRIGTIYRETRGPTATSENGVATLIGLQKSASLSTNNSYYPGSYILDNDSSAIAVTATVKNRQYRIISPGNTDFTAIGAANSTANTVFVATGAGSGTGTVRDFGSEGKLTYQSSSTPRSTGTSSLTSDTGTSDTITTIITKGTTSQSDGSAPSSYSTTGTIQQRARPVLTTIDGTTYYEVVAFSKS